MKTLQSLLPALTLPAALAPLPVAGLQLDSRRLSAGELFLAVPGVHSDGRHYIDQAVAAGVVAVLQDGEALAISERQGVPLITLPHLGRQVADIAARWQGNPAAQLAITGITGTNGKTSISWFLRDALNALGHRCAMVGTLGMGLKGNDQHSGHTTPDPLTLQASLAAFVAQGADSVAMEVSSHALDQHRLGSTPVSTAVFSNLSRDHLDYHGDMDQYLAAKAALFRRDGLQLAVLNDDDPASTTLLSCIGDGVRCVTYGMTGSGVTVGCLSSQASAAGLDATLTVAGQPLTMTVPLYGDFNLSNVMAVVATLHGHGVRLAEIGQAIAAITPVPGRMEPVRAEQGPVVLVDYAHTPDALDKAIQAASAHFPGRLHCVVGCGGDRDSGKRPLMAAAAERCSGQLWLTSDNPRSEDPEQILQQMQAGLAAPQQARIQLDRAQAIDQAIAEAEACDVVLVAGKGHETYQDINGQRLPFDDRQVAAQALAAWGGRV